MYNIYTIYIYILCVYIYIYVYMQPNIYIYIYIWLHEVSVVACGLSYSTKMWGLSSLTKDQTHVPCTARRIPNQWSIGEVPKLLWLLNCPLCLSIFFFSSTYFIYCMTPNATSNLLCLNSSSKCSESPMAQLQPT